MLEEPKGPVAESIRRVAALVAETEAPSRTAKQKQRRSLFARS
jgi:hypothetical protein